MTSPYRPVTEIENGKGEIIRIVIPIDISETSSAVFTVKLYDLMLAWILASKKSSKIPKFDSVTNAPKITEKLQQHRAQKLIDHSKIYPVPMPKITILPDPENAQGYEFAIKEHHVAVIAALMEAGVVEAPVCVNTSMLKNRKVDLPKLAAILQTERPGQLGSTILEDITEENIPFMKGMPRFFSDNLSLRTLAPIVDGLADILIDSRRIVGNPDSSPIAIMEAERKIELSRDFDACRPLVDILVCAGVDGVSLSNHSDGQAVLDSLTPIAETVAEQSLSPIGSAIDLIDRFALTRERLKTRFESFANHTATFSDIQRLTELTRSLARAIVNDKAAYALAKELLPKHIDELHELGKRPEAKGPTTATELLPRGKKDAAPPSGPSG